MLSDVFEFIYAPFLYPLDPSRRIFLFFLLTSTLMILGFNLTTSSKDNRLSIKSLINLRIWLHPSSLLDFKVMVINSLIKGMMITPLLIGKMTVVLTVSGYLYKSLGPSEMSVNHALIVALFSLTLFVVEDASRFIQHWFMHKIPFLWWIHRVHHQAEVLTPLTLYRIHPVEIMISSWRSILVLGGTTGIFVYLFPGQISAVEILGVDAFGFLFNAFGANLRHSHIPLSFGLLNHIFISPFMHQVHHSSLPEHRNKNFGSCLAIWDRLAGSLLIKPMKQDIPFGCKGAIKHRLCNLYFDPFKLNIQALDMKLPNMFLSKNSHRG